jgi:hypothetical protein
MRFVLAAFFALIALAAIDHAINDGLYTQTAGVMLHQIGRSFGVL